MLICIKDSGKGFDINSDTKGERNTDISQKSLSGRGIELIKQLCDSLEYKEKGTLVEASYIWG